LSLFSSELTRTLGAALDDAAIRTQPDSSTEAFLVEQILKAAAHGVHRQEELSHIAAKSVQRVSA
jgi:hypothetical protein